MPEASSIVSPRNQACWAAASGARPRPRAAWNEGPMIRITEPKVLGVSSPNGMAVTSDRPVRRARRKAIAVKIRSPASTPTAVPGIIRPEHKVPRHPEPDQQAGHQDHAADVVDHQPEESVDVAPVEPLVWARNDAWRLKG